MTDSPAADLRAETGPPPCSRAPRRARRRHQRRGQIGGFMIAAGLLTLGSITIPPEEDARKQANSEVAK